MEMAVTAGKARDTASGATAGWSGRARRSRRHRKMGVRRLGQRVGRESIIADGHPEASPADLAQAGDLGRDLPAPAH